jgi:hypothetical protein
VISGQPGMHANNQTSLVSYAHPSYSCIKCGFKKRQQRGVGAQRQPLKSFPIDKRSGSGNMELASRRCFLRHNLLANALAKLSCMRNNCFEAVDQPFWRCSH